MNKTRAAPSEKIQVYRKHKLGLEDKIKEELIGLINDTKHIVNMQLKNIYRTKIFKNDNNIKETKRKIEKGLDMFEDMFELTDEDIDDNEEDQDIRT